MEHDKMARERMQEWHDSLRDGAKPDYGSYQDWYALCEVNALKEQTEFQSETHKREAERYFELWQHTQRALYRLAMDAYGKDYRHVVDRVMNETRGEE